jgi:hypothetical protein
MANITAKILQRGAVVATIKSPTVSQISSNPPVVLKNNVASVNQTYMHNILDVIEDRPQTGDTLIYNESNRKYEVKPISSVDITFDGGTF